jgi:outer membrane receptor protein involved in Fe transport
LNQRSATYYCHYPSGRSSLIRAFAYNVPSSLYATSAGPLTTNLAVIPNVNFQPSGIEYNGIADINSRSGRVPYAQGYAELNYRNAHGLYANLGVLYYGSNNTYNVPAFGILSGSVRVQVTPNSSLQLSVYNITGAYSNSWQTQFGGINVPLVNGTLGTTEAGNSGRQLGASSIGCNHAGCGDRVAGNG